MNIQGRVENNFDHIASIKSCEDKEHLTELLKCVKRDIDGIIMGRNKVLYDEMARMYGLDVDAMILSKLDECNKTKEAIETRLLELG